MSSRFWMFDWLEDNNLTTQEQVASFLTKYKVIEDLRQRAENGQQAAGSQTYKSPSIVAGTGIDLTGGHTACPSPVCMRFQVDELFKHVWHYFESIIVRDAITPVLLGQAEVPRAHLAQIILVHTAPLLYLRETGAQDLVEFVPKMVCYEHWDRHAEEQGLESVIAAKASLIQIICSGAKLSRVGKTFRLESPEIATAVNLGVKGHIPDKEQVKAFIAGKVFDEYLADLTADVQAARTLKVPLGTIRPLHAKMLAASSAPSVADVVFQLNLPFLRGVSLKQLIDLRREEHESFVNFRDSLRKAVEDRLQVRGEADPQRIAEEIRQDVIEPSLRAIRQRLTASQTVLAKKSGTAMFLGVLGTTCGLLAGLAPAAALAAGATVALTGTGNAVSKRLEEDQQTRLDGMYFLWKASEHASH